MKKTTLCFILAILAFSLFCPTIALAEGRKLPSGTTSGQIGQKIQDFVKKHEKTTAGMATAVFGTNGTIYQGSFGYMEKEKGIKVDKDSVFEWGEGQSIPAGSREKTNCLDFCHATLGGGQD